MECRVHQRLVRYSFWVERTCGKLIRKFPGQLLPNLCTGGQGWSFPTKYFKKSVSSKVEGCRVQKLISWTCNFFGFVWKASFCSLFQQHFLEELWRNGMERHFLVWALRKKQQESFLAERKRLEVPWDEVWISWNSIDSSQTPFGNVNAYLLIFIWFWYEFLIWMGQKQMANIWGFEIFLKVFFRNMVSTLWSMLVRKPSNQKRAKNGVCKKTFSFFWGFSTSPLKWWEFTFFDIKGGDISTPPKKL